MAANNVAVGSEKVRVRVAGAVEADAMALDRDEPRAFTNAPSPIPPGEGPVYQGG